MLAMVFIYLLSVIILLIKALRNKEMINDLQGKEFSEICLVYFPLVLGGFFLAPILVIALIPVQIHTTMLRHHN